MEQELFITFLIHAKQHTYAAGGELSASSRPASHDLQYSEGDVLYIDTYLGGFHFIGEEAVWEKGLPVWGMNYYGKMLVEKVPEGFGEFLKSALMRVPRETPFRGPKDHSVGNYAYHCVWKGDLKHFEGTEEISLDGKAIYQLGFHGGEVL